MLLPISYYKIQDMYSHLRWHTEERTTFAFGPVLQSGWRLARPLKQATHAQLGLVRKYSNLLGRKGKGRLH
jgi:hypothetical protein